MTKRVVLFVAAAALIGGLFSLLAPGPDLLAPALDAQRRAPQRADEPPLTVRGIHASFNPGRRRASGSARKVPGRRHSQSSLAALRVAVVDDHLGDGCAQPSGAGQSEWRVRQSPEKLHRHCPREPVSGSDGLLRQPGLQPGGLSGFWPAGRRPARERRPSRGGGSQVLQEFRDRGHGPGGRASAGRRSRSSTRCSRSARSWGFRC